ncbi:MAG: hypothetical protein JXA89_24980, partial [Anaerolineae bacterium]|nr:hypothetical protein [Anaerolineae bacterium]
MIDINSLVRGLAWHDVGKPFYMNSERHGILGYLLLYAAGCPDEALVAMAHHWGSLYQHLSWYRDQANSVRTLPAVIAMANTLDVAAATLYSFMEQNPGGPQGPEARHSWQNPFSRLPQHSPVFNDAFNVPQDSVTDAHLAHLAYLETWPDPEATPALAPETIALLSQIVGPDNIRGNDRQRYGPIPSAAQHELALQALLACTAFYPERTYPPVNDTTLQAHAHLSGVLAFVLYRNLEAAQPDFMAQQIVLRERDILLGGQPLRDARAQTYDLAMHHLDGYLVRLSLSGHEDLFNNAVRLDDLHGTRKLAQLTLDALVETMAGALGVPGLGDYLVLTRTPFDLVYYLPGCMASSQIEETIGRAYAAAVERVTGDLLGQLERDFRRASQPLDWMSERHTLRRQLHSLAYGIRSIPVKVEPKAEIEKPGERFDDFNARFAETLVRAYAASLDHLDFSRREWRAVQADLELPGGDDGSVHDICQVCETQPIYEAFNEQMRDDDDLRKAAHEFRGEPEPICISCIARRILAHGAVRSEPLEKMLCLNGHIVTAGQKDGPSLPPNLARTATFASDDDHLDMGAAFVRKSHRAGKKLDVFPTVHYAADETGNVALLTLQPTGALFGTYDHARMVEWLKEPPNLDQLGSAYKAQSLRDAFEATFVNYYKQVERAKPHLVEHVTRVRPHLARVLSRIA